MSVRGNLSRGLFGLLLVASIGGGLAQGPGRVWLQTMPAQNLAKAIMPYLPKPSSS